MFYKSLFVFLFSVPLISLNTLLIAFVFIVDVISDTVERWYLSLRSDGSVAVVGVSPKVRVAVMVVGPDGKTKIQVRKLPAQWITKDTRCVELYGWLESWMICFMQVSGM